MGIRSIMFAAAFAALAAGASAQTPPPSNTPLAEFVATIPATKDCRAFFYAESDLGECVLRLEVLMPLATVDRFVDVVPDGVAKTTWDERQAIRPVVAQYLAPFNRVIADGKAVELEGADTDYFTVKSMWMPVLRDARVEDTMVAYVARYRLPSAPRNLAAEWHLFGEGAEEVRLAAILGAAEPAFATLTEASPRFDAAEDFRPVAPRPMENVDVGAATPGEIASDYVKADAVVRGVLLNVYRAFEQPDAAAAREVLGRSLDPSLVEPMFAMVRAGMNDPQALGAVPRVNGVSIMAGDMLGSDDVSFRYRAAWRAEAVAAHWGHDHRRPAGCEAVLTFGRRDGSWYIARAENLVAMP